MAIKQYIHGAGKDYQLWGNVGRFLVDRTVQSAMGNCISSRNGDIWWLCLSHNKQTRGFASARIMKNERLYLRYFYCAEKSPLGLDENVLIAKAIKYAKEKTFTMVYTHWEKNSEILANMGFIAIPKARGDFCRWELKLEEKSDD